MNIANKTVLAPAPTAGLGRRSSKRRSNEARRESATRSTLQHPDSRVTPLTLDVTDAPQIQQAAEAIGGLDVLINNVGIAIYDDLSNPGIIEQHLAANLFGMLSVTRAFLPLLRRSEGSIVNNLSLTSLAPLPVIFAYSISKAATFSMTQSLRALLAGQGITVHAVLLGPIEGSP